LVFGPRRGAGDVRAGRPNWPRTRSPKTISQTPDELIRAPLVQAHLGITGQVEVAGNTGVIDERYHTLFCIVVRRDTHSPPGFDVAIASAELGPVDMEFDSSAVPPEP
jgi:hypothetical protein